MVAFVCGSVAPAASVLVIAGFSAMLVFAVGKKLS
jgi:hypothetical protein